MSKILFVVLTGLFVTACSDSGNTYYNSKESSFYDCVRHSGKPKECAEAVNTLYSNDPKK